MRRVMLAISAAVFLVASNSAVLADEAVGVIVSIDVEAGTVTLDSGQTFILTETIDRSALEIGQDVSVTYEPTTDGLDAATMIEPIV